MADVKELNSQSAVYDDAAEEKKYLEARAKQLEEDFQKPFDPVGSYRFCIDTSQQ